MIRMHSFSERNSNHAGLCPTGDYRTNVFKSNLQFLSKRMDPRELREVVCQGIGNTTSKEACLTHPPTEELSEPTSFRNVLFGTYQARTDGGACMIIYNSEEIARRINVNFEIDLDLC